MRATVLLGLGCILILFIAACGDEKARAARSRAATATPAATPTATSTVPAAVTPATANATPPRTPAAAVSTSVAATIPAAPIRTATVPVSVTRTPTPTTTPARPAGGNREIVPIRPAPIKLDSGTFVVTKVEWTDRWCSSGGMAECMNANVGEELFVFSVGDLTQPTARDLVLYCFAPGARPLIYVEDEDTGAVYRCRQYFSLGGGEAVAIFTVPASSRRYYLMVLAEPQLSIHKP
jgi:hypothetical protein